MSPANLKPVSRDEFFAALHEDKRDIMPTCAPGRSDYSEWRTNDTRRILFGESHATGRYNEDGTIQHEYFLVEQKGETP